MVTICNTWDARAARDVQVKLRYLSLIVTGIMAASLLVALPGSVASAKADLPALQTERSVHGKKVPIRPAKVTPSRNWMPPAPAWPSAASTEVAIGSSGCSHRRRSFADQGWVVASAAWSTSNAASSRWRRRSQRVRVALKDRAATARAGVDGLLLSVERETARLGLAESRSQVDYSKFRFAFGADWASRLRLVMVPACALTNT